MRKFLLLLIFSGSLFFSANAFAQQYREPSVSSQKADDGVLVAYPNPARDFIIVKAKNPASKIKSVSFYSILGVQVLDVAVNMASGEINLDRLRPGRYLMKYTMADNTQRVTQIIKQ